MVGGQRPLVESRVPPTQPLLIFTTFWLSWKDWEGSLQKHHDFAFPQSTSEVICAITHSIDFQSVLPKCLRWKNYCTQRAMSNTVDFLLVSRFYSKSCSTVSAGPTGTQGEPPSRSSSSLSSPSCWRPGHLVQRPSSRLAKSYFSSAPQTTSVQNQDHCLVGSGLDPKHRIPSFPHKNTQIEIHLVTWSSSLLYISGKHRLELCSFLDPETEQQ